ncbi:IDEAL domain-containing protein [Bacillus atrophaeus]|nr:IDEAL domain-containing protein [Bacillus atrophaeus]
MVYKDAKFKELIDQALDTGDKKWFEEKIQQEKMKG